MLKNSERLMDQLNRIRISSNCVELIFGKGHLSTLGASRDAVFLVLLSAKRFDSGGLLQCKDMDQLIDLVCHQSSL